MLVDVYVKYDWSIVTCVVILCCERFASQILRTSPDCMALRLNVGGFLKMETIEATAKNATRPFIPVTF
jgi:hypothetical protein